MTNEAKERKLLKQYAVGEKGVTIEFNWEANEASLTSDKGKAFFSYDEDREAWKCIELVESPTFSELE